MSFIPQDPLRNIILVAPGGSLGSVLLEGLLAESTFNVSVLVRKSSRSIDSLSKYSGIQNVIKVADDYPHADLVEAFIGKDAVVNALTGSAATLQFGFIDAAIEAGVKRYVPSEYGLDNSKQKARELTPVFGDKGRVREYLVSKEHTGLTWHAIACGMWIKWTITFADDGNGRFSTSTMEHTSLALNRSLLNPSLTRNKLISISDFATSQAELVAAIERNSGQQWRAKRVDSGEVIEEQKKLLDQGDSAAMYKLVEMGFVTGQYGGWFEELGEVWNQRLGIPKTELGEIVRDAIDAM